VTIAPWKARVTGITAPLAASVTCGQPATPTVAVAWPWTSTATVPAAVTPAQAHDGCPGQSTAALVTLLTRASPSPAVAMTSVSARSSGPGSASRPSATTMRSAYRAISPAPASGTQLVIFMSPAQDRHG
jgi:hypothetical protein